jgi:hypothetical protein
VAHLPLTVALASALAALMHWWPRLDPVWRRRVSLLTSVAGIAFLLAALQAEGQRESALTSYVLLGPATRTAVASARASLYYSVLTAVCLLLGFAGLAMGETLSRWLRPRPLLSASLVAWLVTAVRFLLEKSAAPVALTDAFGVTWLAPFAGASLATAFPGGRPPGWGALARRLAAYALLVRGVVAALGVVATRGALGTHYDVSALTTVPLALVGQDVAFAAGSWRQVLWLTLVPQLVVWPAYTVLAGLAGAALALRLASARRFV